MFSYRHAFHAGNHADVLKHAILVHTLDYFNRKDAPYWVIDTHAGAGLYSLDGDWATKTAESADGIGRLWSATTCRPSWPSTCSASAPTTPTAGCGAIPARRG